MMMWRGEIYWYDFCENINGIVIVDFNENNELIAVRLVRRADCYSTPIRTEQPRVRTSNYKMDWKHLVLTDSFNFVLNEHKRKNILYY